MNVIERIEMWKNYIEWTRTIWNNKSPEENKEHYILGLISEIGELATDRKKVVAYGNIFPIDNARAELGDRYYFLARYIDEQDLNIEALILAATAFEIAKKEKLDKMTFLEIIIYMVQSCINLYTTISDFEGSKKLDSTASAIAVMTAMANNLGIDEKTAIDINRAKLTKRFNGEFSKEKANNRDLDGEMEAIRSVEINDKEGIS